MDDIQIKKLIDISVKRMYKNKYPNAKRWSLEKFYKIFK